MWDWYNRPGRRGVPATGTIILIMVVGGLLIGILFTLIYAVIAPHIFVRVPA